MRGAKGGYILARKPQNISVLDVYRCIERLDDVVSVFETNIESPNVAQEVWQEATDAAQSVLQKYTLFDLCEKLAVRKQMELMYYI
nr:Rrf2 family transcriptional regulator [Tolypothrix sp. PCC 7910]